MSDRPPLAVHLLGDLRVVRGDGTVVGDQEWATGKTMDLFRLLALQPGRPVRTAGLVDKLWPHVGDRRAHNSLRTAVSQIRRSVCGAAVQRQREGLVLTGAWVDHEEHAEHVRRGHQAHAEGRSSDVLHHARCAEELYRGDFHAHDDNSGWARTERERLVRVRTVQLAEAAEAAVALQAWTTAVELGETAFALAPSSGSATLSLMEAHAAQGELGRALQVFERHRRELAEELGVDPSPQTGELHLRLLRQSR